MLLMHRAGTDTKIKVQNVDPGEETSPAAPARTQTCNLSITSLAL